MTGWSITAGGLTPAQVAGVLDLAAAAAAADSVAPLSEHVLLHLRYDAATPGAGPGLDRHRPGPVTGGVVEQHVEHLSHRGRRGRGRWHVVAHHDPQRPAARREAAVPGRADLLDDGIHR